MKIHFEHVLNFGFDKIFIIISFVILITKGDLLIEIFSLTLRCKFYIELNLLISYHCFVKIVHIYHEIDRIQSYVYYLKFTP